MIESVAEVTGSEKVAQFAGNVDLLARLGTAMAQGLQFTVIGLDQKRYGPVTGEKLVKWLGEGRIDQNTPVQVEGSSSWQPIHLLPEMLQQNKIPLPPKWKWGGGKK